MTRSNGTLRSEFQLWNRCTIARGSVRSGSGRKELSPFSPWQERRSSAQAFFRRRVSLLRNHSAPTEGAYPNVFEPRQ
jgi:hypothetical protein